MLGRLRCKRFPEKSLILSGVSMGSASVMMASVLSLPSSVKALICDCGYTAPAEIIKETIRSFHLPVSFCYALLHFGARIFGTSISVNQPHYLP